MILEVVVVLVVLGVAALIGLAKRWYDGRFRPVARSGVLADAGAEVARSDRLTADDLGAPLGERATLVQFSSAFCAPCRTMRHVLGSVASAVPGVRHVELDAESHLELVRRLGVRRTPTTLLLDAQGRVHTRASGAARRAVVVAALNETLAAVPGGTRDRTER